MTFQEAAKKLMEGGFDEIMLRPDKNGETKETGLYITAINNGIDYAPGSRRYTNSVDIDNKNWYGIKYEWVHNQVKIEPLPANYKPGKNIYD